MCGIAGFVSLNNNPDQATQILGQMLDRIRHRGPDDSGIWVNGAVALGHRRLSILDLSSAGHQPMASACGRFVIVFNGEIYNHLDLRRQLAQAGEVPPAGWRGHSDTETLLTCFTTWGVETTLKATVGMFALALWDKQDRSLLLARDRIGEKPLYYGWQGDVFLFGSELKALKVHPSFDNHIDWAAASSFLRANYVPAPYSIYQGVNKLLPGTWLRLAQSDIAQRISPAPFAYWSLAGAALDGLNEPFTGSFNDAVDQLEELVRQAVKLQSVADVPVGAFLSGGIDSSTVVAMMRSATTSKVITFAIGMPDSRIDESKYAAAVARHLGTNHVEHIIQPQEALDLIPRLAEIWDEPFADSSQIPTYLVSKLAKQTVTVALSGDGGDEFFLGYQQYRLYDKLWRTRCLGKLPWDLAFSALRPFSQSRWLERNLDRSRSIVNAWRQPNAQLLNRYWMDGYRGGKLPINRNCELAPPKIPNLPDPAAAAALWDASTYLPDDVLAKVDRSSMANSLETRAPLLDHRIVEFSYRLPTSFKLHNGQSKRVLRELLYKHVPRAIVNRPKAGFSIPLGKWLVEDLRDWSESAIESASRNEMYDATSIRTIWNEHKKLMCHTEKIWAIISLQKFMEQNGIREK